MAYRGNLYSVWDAFDGCLVLEAGTAHEVNLVTGLKSDAANMARRVWNGKGKRYKVTRLEKAQDRKTPKDKQKILDEEMDFSNLWNKYRLMINKNAKK